MYGHDLLLSHLPDRCLVCSHPFLVVGLQALYKQQCSQCKEWAFPYRVEALICSRCGEKKCVCEVSSSSSSSSEDEKDDEDDEELAAAMANLEISSSKKKRRHIDDRKPHRSDLCERCQEGKPCQANQFDSN